MSWVRFQLSPDTGMYALAYYSSDRLARRAEDAHQVDAAMLSCQLESLHLAIKLLFHDDPCNRHSIVGVF